MASAAPRVSRRLLAQIERLAARDLSYAEINRRVGGAAEELELPRPSYQTVRVLVRAARELRAGPSGLEIASDVALRLRSPRELLDHATGLPVRDLNRTRK